MNCATCTAGDGGSVGEPRLWFEGSVFLDAGPGSAFEWNLALERYLQVRAANIAYVTVRYHAVGAGAGTTTLQFQRTSVPTDDSGAFENMGAPLALTRGRGYLRSAFGQDTTVGAHGLMRFVMSNAGTGSDWALVHLSVWVVLQQT
ncbi:MAG: hypothetical protein ACOYOB_18715 [Myxococcota bacterium]